MSDGVQLVAGISYPTDLTTGQQLAGPFPVAMTYSPYTNTPDPYFAQYGYISVAVRIRGTGQSGGVWQLGMDGQDSIDIIHWAAHELAGSNGHIGMYGCSAAGASLIFTAEDVSPGSGLDAIVPQCAGADANYQEAFFSDGIPTNFVPFTGDLSVPNMNTSSNAPADAFINNVESGGTDAYDGSFWTQYDGADQPITNIDRNNVATLLWSGWCDIFPIGALNLYTELQNLHAGRDPMAPMTPGEPVTGRYQIIMGQWQPISPAYGNVCHGGGLDNGIVLEWFDTWVKHIDTGIANTSTPMHLFEVGSNRWINARDYPMVSDYTRYYLNSAGALTVGPATTRGSETIAWAPPTPAGANTVSYTSEALTAGATLAGPISLTVHATSTTQNMELIGTLYDVAPDGTATEITTGTSQGSRRALNPVASWRDDNGVLIRPWKQQLVDQWLTPGQPYTFNMMMSPRLYAVAPGHALRLTITTQATAAECANPLGSSPCVYTAPQLATLPGGVYSLLHGPGEQSSLNLPILPYGFYPSIRSGITPTSGTETEPLDWGVPGHNTSHG